MQTFFDSISSSTTGLPLQGVAVQVNLFNAGGATIFSDEAGTILADNPLASDANGFFQFFAVDGIYDLVISGAGIATHTISGISLVSSAASGTIATALQTSTTIVNVSAANAPTVGQALIATGGTAATWQTLRESIIATIGDDSTPLTTGTAKFTFRMPYALVLTDLRGSLTGAQTAGSIFTVDVKESGVTVLSTLLTIDNNELTSVTAATPVVISDSTLASDAEMTIDITQIGNGTATGLKVALIGHR